MTNPFENPAELANKPKGIKWPSAAVIAVGVGLAGWYVFAKGDPKPVASDRKKDVLHPPPGHTTQQQYTDRHAQQNRTPPPSQQTPAGR